MTISTELQPSTFTPERIPSQSRGQSHSQYSILLADTNIEFRRGLRSLLEFYDHHGSTCCVVIGEAISKGQVLQQASVLHPRLILLDTTRDRMTPARCLVCA